VRRVAALLFCGALAAMLLVGCRPNEEVGRYEVPRDPYPVDPTFTKPDAWKTNKPIEMARWTFLVGDGDQTAIVTVTPLPAESGSILQNVNRWRVKQLLLPPINKAQLDAGVTTLDAGGLTAKYVDLTGKYAPKEGEKTDRKDDRILGAILLYKGVQTWFFKMQGPPEVVGKHKNDFEEFVRSVRFDGGKQ
jgi:hypothetical protein